jgi:hypothetical protein
MLNITNKAILASAQVVEIYTASVLRFDHFNK